jgi:hypothetical protein
VKVDFQSCVVLSANGCTQFTAYGVCEVMCGLQLT